MSIAFVIDHFRLVQIDQLSSLSKVLSSRTKLIGIEIYSSSDPDYPFGSWTGEGFVHEQVFKTDVRGRHSILSAALGIVKLCRQHKASVIFLCHYERSYIFLAAVLLRLLGRRVIVMGDSKFDDYPRHFWREFGKRLLYLPYQGALAASERCAEYQRFLGVPPDSIALNYYAFDIERIRMAADLAPAPISDFKFEDRNFVCVARLVPKKNIATLIEAFSRFARAAHHPRNLVLCGSGPLEAELRVKAAKFGVSDRIAFRGNLNPTEIAHELARGLCLILPSVEEQYGIAVVEAQAMGLPVILSTNCGSRDLQVRSGVNGFVIEPDNPEGLAFFMLQLAHDEALWRDMAVAAARFAERGNVDKFVDSAILLARLDSQRPENVSLLPRQGRE